MHVAQLITSEYDGDGITFDDLRQFVEIVQRDYAGQYWKYCKVIVRCDEDQLNQIAIQHDPKEGM